MTVKGFLFLYGPFKCKPLLGWESSTCKRACWCNLSTEISLCYAVATPSHSVKSFWRPQVAASCILYYDLCRLMFTCIYCQLKVAFLAYAKNLIVAPHNNFVVINKYWSSRCTSNSRNRRGQARLWILTLWSFTTAHHWCLHEGSLNYSTYLQLHTNLH